MPFTSQEITDAGKIGLDFYLRNNPIDNVKTDDPLFDALSSRKKAAPGAKQYIVEQLRVRYQSNFTWFNGSQIVTYNRRQTIEQAQYAWRSAHDGFALDEDRLIQNGISVHDDAAPRGGASADEMVALSNLIEEQSIALREGFIDKFCQALHLDGTQSVDAITGLDSLVSTTPSTGTVGGINRATSGNEYWRNYAPSSALTTTTTTGNVLDFMEIGWRASIRNGGRPNFIEAGGDFIDGLRNFIIKTYGAGGGLAYPNAPFAKSVGVGTESLKFHDLEVQWNPKFDDLQALTGAATSWLKRCYQLNLNYIKLRPISGQDMITRKPPRAYDRYEWYWGLTWRGALTMGRANAQAVYFVS